MKPGHLQLHPCQSQQKVSQLLSPSVRYQSTKIICPVMKSKLSGSKPTTGELRVLSPKAKCLFREWERLTVDDGILYRATAARKQLVLPDIYKAKVLEELHNNMGHQGAERTLSLICDRFFWPYMQSDVEHYVTRVCTCLKQKKPCRDTRAPLANIVTTHPFELAYNMPVRIKQASTSKSGKTHLQ